MSARAFCTVDASVSRNTVVSGNRLGAATTHLASLLITPLWPVGRETIRLLDLNSPREMKECFHCPVAGAALPDVKERDILVVGSKSYPIDAVLEWTDNDIPCLHIIVGEVKTT
jgi:hypothetical protein